MTRLSKYDGLNQRMRGRLPDYLRTRRAREESYQDIADQLWVGYGVRVTDQTVKNWCEEKETAE